MSSTYRCKLRILWSIVSAALISACGAHGNPGQLPALNPSDAGPPPASSRTFHFTHAAQKFRVPAGVTKLTITAYGAAGAGYMQNKNGPLGALGAEVKATIPVRPGKLLIVLVGGRGIKPIHSGGGGGFNGGGDGGAYGGGGSSDVRTGGRVIDRILVAGGGGGSGENGSWFNGGSSSSSSGTLFAGPGGIGGGWLTGGDGGAGSDGGGGGGGASHTVGGVHGVGRSGWQGSFSSSTHCNAVDGSKGKLHEGGAGADPSCGPAGGGGGGGYYGGGGGGGGGYYGDTETGTVYFSSGGGGGGGGGSSFVEKSATNIHRIAGGGLPGDGLIIITW